jgi:hypothetical protein
MAQAAFPAESKSGEVGQDSSQNRTVKGPKWKLGLTIGPHAFQNRVQLVCGPLNATCARSRGFLEDRPFTSQKHDESTQIRSGTRTSNGLDARDNLHRGDNHVIEGAEKNAEGETSSQRPGEWRLRKLAILEEAGDMKTID